MTDDQRKDLVRKAKEFVYAQEIQDILKKDPRWVCTGASIERDKCEYVIALEKYDQPGDIVFTKSFPYLDQVKRIGKFKKEVIYVQQVEQLLKTDPTWLCFGDQIFKENCEYVISVPEKAAKTDTVITSSAECLKRFPRIGKRRFKTKKDKTDLNPFRHPSISFDQLYAKYAKYRGYKCSDTKKSLPEPIWTRKQAYDYVQTQKELTVGVTQVIDFEDELWLFGVLSNSATVSLKLQGFEPSFDILCPGPEFVSQEAVDRLKFILNSHNPYATKQQKDCKRRTSDPVTRVQIVYQQNGTLYKQRKREPFFRIFFQSMSAFKTYRLKIAKGDIAIGFKPRLFGETFSSLQIFRNQYCCPEQKGITVNVQKCRFLKPDSYEQWTKFVTSNSNDYYNLEIEDGSQEDLGLTLPPVSTFLTGSYHAKDIKVSHEDIVIPFVVAFFDIETKRHDSAVHQAKQNLKPFIGPEDLPKGIHLVYPCQIEFPEAFTIAQFPQLFPICIRKNSILYQNSDRQFYVAPVSKETFEIGEPKPIEAKDANVLYESEPQPDILQGCFPMPRNKLDSAVVISTHFMIYGDNKPFLETIHCLGTDVEWDEGDLPDTAVYLFERDDEKGMLEHWSSMLRFTFDIEWLAGYNSIKYDDAYLCRHAHAIESMLTLQNLSRFHCLPKDKKKKRRFKACLPHTMRRCDPDETELPPSYDIPGVIQYDALPVVKNVAATMDEFTLKHVASVWLKNIVNKKDMPYDLISPYWAVGGRHLRRLIIYCRHDVILLQEIVVVRSLLAFSISLNKTCLTGIDQLMTRGQAIRTWNLIVYHSFQQKWALDEDARQEIQEIVGYPKRPRTYLMQWGERAEIVKGEKYEGATVLDPAVDFYMKHVGTVDFASLYPSIIDSHILDPSSYVPIQYDSKTKTLWVPLYDKSAQERDLSRYVIWRPDLNEPKPFVEQDKDLILVAYDRVADIHHGFVQNRGSFFPLLLRSLVAARKVVKKKMEHAQEQGDYFMEAVYDAEQAAKKITCNAGYGFFGAPVSQFPMIAIASTTCVIGRSKIELTRNTLKSLFQASPIYGDSVPGDTPVLVKRKDGSVRFEAIEKLSDWGPNRLGKQYAEPESGMKVWSDQGWTAILSVMRHRTKKRLFRVVTGSGCVDVTEDHSLLLKSGKEVKPTQVGVGTDLLHCALPISDKFQYCSTSGKLKQAETWYKHHCLDPLKQYETKVQSITDLGFTNDYVYDLETENHHFSAGIGNLVVHNTDSVFAYFEWVDNDAKLSEVEKLENVRCLLIHACSYISSLLPVPMKLEFEKIMKPFLMIQKKTYVGRYRCPPEKAAKGFLFKGTSNVRRDSCVKARQCIEEMLRRAIDYPYQECKILEPLHATLAEITKPDFNPTIFAKTCSRKEVYKNPDCAQVHFFKKLRKRMGCEIEVGSRTKYVIVLPDNGKRVRTKQDNFKHSWEELEYAICNNIRIDRWYYVETQIWNRLKTYLGSIVDQKRLEAIFLRAKGIIFQQDATNRSIDSMFRRIDQVKSGETKAQSKSTEKIKPKAKLKPKQTSLLGFLTKK
jgi:DNA polymerase elongation subunit (family B)